VVIDPDLFDLSRIEVLRGPQGTLYGSGSMGGTIKLITNAPVLDKFEGAVDTAVSGTQGGGLNRGGSAMVNLPFGTTVALRIVGTQKFTDGWIDRIVANDFPLPTGTCAGWVGTGCVRGNVAAAPVAHIFKNANTELLTGGRATLLVKPSDDLSFTTTLMYQRIAANGYNQIQDPPGTLAIYQPFNIPEPISDTFKLASETITYNFDFAQFTSATSYFKRSEVQTQDSTESLENLFNLGVFLPISYTEEDDSQQFSQELRLTSNGEGDWKWVGGLFFSNLHSSWIDTNQSPAYAVLSTGGAGTNPSGIVYNSDNPYTLKQSAAFGDVTYRFNPSLSLTAGLRYYRFDSKLDYFQTGIGTATGTDIPTAGANGTSATGVNPKVTLSYTPTGDFTLYGNLSRGYRPGGVSLPVPTTPGGAVVCPNVPQTYGPDDVWNGEVGEKTRFMDGRLTLNADVYYIKWQQIQQIVVLSCGYPYTTNLGDARSYGTEIEVATKLTPSLTLSATANLDSSTITNAAADSGYTAGERILNIPKFTGSLALTYSRPVFANHNLMVRASDNYTGSLIDASYFREELPGYSLVDFRTGLVGEPWSVYLFVNNVTNKIAELTIDNTSLAWVTPSITRVTTNQPRTAGVELAYKF
jgi:iron complex outermembrane receptor protein